MLVSRERNSLKYPEFKVSNKDLPPALLASVIQVLQSVKDGKLQQNVAKINSNNLPPQQEVLRALALLLNENKNEVSETVASLLTATAENRHFREKVSGRKSPFT